MASLSNDAGSKHPSSRYTCSMAATPFLQAWEAPWCRTQRVQRVQPRVGKQRLHRVDTPTVARKEKGHGALSNEDGSTRWLGSSTRTVSVCPCRLVARLAPLLPISSASSSTRGSARSSLTATELSGHKNCPVVECSRIHPRICQPHPQHVNAPLFIGLLKGTRNALTAHRSSSSSSTAHLASAAFN